MRDGLGIDSPRMGPGRPTKVMGKRSVPVELDYSITPGDWDKPFFGLWPHTTVHIHKQTNKQYLKFDIGGQFQKNVIVVLIVVSRLTWLS
jgi:hypothetical protein